MLAICCWARKVVAEENDIIVYRSCDHAHDLLTFKLTTISKFEGVACHGMTMARIYMYSKCAHFQIFHVCIQCNTSRALYISNSEDIYGFN